MKKCIIMFTFLVAALLIAAWSNKNRKIDTKNIITSKVHPPAKHLLVQDNTPKNRKRN